MWQFLLRKNGRACGSQCMPNSPPPSFPLMLTTLTPTSGYPLGALEVLRLGWVLLKMMLDSYVKTHSVSQYWWRQWWWRTCLRMCKGACVCVFISAPGYICVWLFIQVYLVFFNVCVSHVSVKMLMGFKKWSCLTPTWQTKKHWDSDNLNNYFVIGSELEHHTISPVCHDT